MDTNAGQTGYQGSQNLKSKYSSLKGQKESKNLSPTRDDDRDEWEEGHENEFGGDILQATQTTFKNVTDNIAGFLKRNAVPVGIGVATVGAGIMYVTGSFSKLKGNFKSISLGDNRDNKVKKSKNKKKN